MGQTFFAQIATFMRETMPALVAELRSLNTNLREHNDRERKREAERKET